MSDKYVTRDFCDERFQRILEMLEHIEQKIDKMMSDKFAEVGLSTNSKRKGREAFRVFGYAVVGGVIVAAINYLFGKV